MANSLRPRRWRIGDQVFRPWRTRRHATEVIGGWHRGEVIAIRRTRVIVRSFGHDYEHPAHELRPVVHRRAIDRLHSSAPLPPLPTYRAEVGW